MLCKDYALCAYQFTYTENLRIVIWSMGETNFLLFKYLV